MFNIVKTTQGNLFVFYEFCSIICNKDFEKSEFCYPMFLKCGVSIISVKMGYKIECRIVCKCIHSYHYKRTSF